MFRTIMLITTTMIKAAWRVMWLSWIRAPSKDPVVSLSKKLYHYCLVLVGSKNGFERDFTIEIN